ncbi:MAG: hypothetical protein EP344_09570 [Bacteroidetes bacterium]|nr:MAG: hypothetical protein EP344_09570 [Bacteroidota bacterium]
MCRSNNYPVLLALAIATAGCSDIPEKAIPETGFTLPYQLDHPDTMFKLPSGLREISGLGLAADSVHLIAINDEEGKLFFLNTETGAVEEERRFGKNNDYEGVEVVGTDIYVVRSNGTLYCVPDSGKTSELNTKLNSDYDVEGLAYDAASHALLLACKGRAGKGDAFTHKKAIYAFDLKQEKLRKKPAFLIDREEVARWKGQNSGFMARVLEFLDADQAASAFSPSGLAFSPIDSNLYVIASVGKALAVVRPDGSLAILKQLNTNRFPQPEGLCFDRAGRMYISTEGKGAAGRIYRFSPVTE